MEEEMEEMEQEQPEMEQPEMEQPEMDQDEIDQALWAEKCELKQGTEPNEEDFEEYESISDGDEDYELERALVQEEEN